MSRATKLIESVSNLRIKLLNENSINFRIGGIVQTDKGVQVLINNVPEGNVTLLNDPSHTMVVELFGEKLEFTPDKLNFKDPYSKLINWDIPISEIAERHRDEIEAHASIGKDNRRKAKELYQSDPKVQQERSIQVLQALRSGRPYLQDSNYAYMIKSIDAGSKPFEYNIDYEDKNGIHSITIDLSGNKSIWATSLSKKKLVEKLLPDIISQISEYGFSGIKFNF